MKKSSILFIFILLLCIGLQYETIYYTDGSRSGAEYGLMGVSIFLALFYMIPALYFLFRIGKKWELPKKVLILSLLGGMFLLGWLSSFANTYIHDLLGVLFPDSPFLNAFESAIVAPLVEEPLKLLPLVFVLALIPVRKLKFLFLLGIASGLGFQMIEDIGYIRTDLPEGFDFTISRILERIISGIASHWTFSGLAVVGVYLLYRAYKGQKVGKKQGLIFLGLALGTHFLFNSPFVELETELPLAIPVVTAIALYGFYHAYFKPKTRVAIVTCMDSRLHVAQALGLALGDAHILRNAGGRVTEDMIRSLVISQQQMGTREIVVLHHTDCGAQTFENEPFQEYLKEELGVDVSDQDFLPFQDIEESVREDMQLLIESPLIPDDVIISGAIYNVDTGSMTVVEL
ncbi:repair protein [Streptococcus pneumoniae]|nr:repair protein [Streptococcus pneumoniae]